MRSPAAAGLAGKGAELLTQVLLVTAVPAVMGPEGYGEFALTLAVVMIGSATITLGGPAVLTRYIPAAAPDDRDAVARALVVRLGVVRSAQVAVAALAGLALALADAGTFPPVMVGAVVAALVLDVAATVAFQAVLGFGHARLWSARFALQNVVLAASAMALFEAGGARAAVWSLAVASGVALLAVAGTAVPRLRRARRGAPVPEGALRFGAYQAVSSALLHIQHRGGVVAVALLAGAGAEVGYASLALGIGLAGTYAIREAFTVELPGLVERTGEDTPSAERHSRRLALWTMALVLPVAAVGAVWGGDLLALAAGEDFRAAEPALGPALALLPLAPLTALTGQVAALRLRPEARLWSTAVGLAAFLAVALAAVPSGGAEAATFAVLAGAAGTLAAMPLVLPGALPPLNAAVGFAGAGLVLLIS